MDTSALFGLLLTSLAGLATGIGSAVALFARRGARSFLAASLGFSAGVMVYVSFVELLPTATLALGEAQGAHLGPWIATAAFFGGLVVTSLIDFLVPSWENPHEAAVVGEGPTAGRSDLHRMGLLTALVIGIHNFPEGFATMFAAQSDPTLGVTIAVAIAIHNIPEGISVAVPIFYATGNRKRAFWLSFLSGVTEPIGAVIGYLVLRPFLTPTVLNVTLAAIAGVMVFISLDQLVPNAKKYDEGHQAVYGLIAGMAVMALSLLLM